jgi:hydrogenase maturation protein HypF
VPATQAMPIAIEARQWLITGRVQGVGFRPFVYRIAVLHGVRGHVKNCSGQVEIFAEGSRVALDDFARALIDNPPPLARPHIASVTRCLPMDCDTFHIVPSDDKGAADVHVPPDFFCCDDCLDELNDPRDRRHRYPFINCTQCGPRYTLIERLPYDRPNTSMAGFALCAQCLAEYEDPANRRYHAEPVACPACGPSLSFRTSDGADICDSEQALAGAIAALRAGRIVAVKGIGGYHLLVDATSEPAVQRLRRRKARPHKPLAVMFPFRDGDAALRAAVALDATTEGALTDPMRPIVLAKRRPGARLAESIAPGLSEIGVMLPYSPLHHLLLTDFDAPLVATSGNVSGEPVLTDNAEAEARLADVADAFLHHDRPIVRPADDPVLRVIAGRARPIRLGRGVAPVEIALPFILPRPVLAVGGHLKNTLALAWAGRAVISPHIGDLSSPRSLRVFEQTIADLQALHRVTAEAVVCDAHPAYASTRWARASRLPVTTVFHHHAHASALAGEHPDVARWLTFTWDGVGFGEDGSLWGGEALLGWPGRWRRVASMRPFHLPGGERAGREPWRSAAALCWETGLRWARSNADLVFDAWKKRINSPRTSAVGRLFDGAAALIGLLDEASFEGQGPMWLEAIATDMPAQSLPLVRSGAGLWTTDWSPLIPLLLNTAMSPAERAGVFHMSLAQALLEQAKKVRDEHGTFAVGLTGGVFQNRLLTEAAIRRLQVNGFDVRIAERVPCNDAGLSFGQIVSFGQIMDAENRQ